MEENKEKPTYEQLEALADQLRKNNFQLAGKVTQLQRQMEAINLNLFNMKFLFKVLKHKDCFPAEFVNDCANNIMQFFMMQNEPIEGAEGITDTEPKAEE